MSGAKKILFIIAMGLATIGIMSDMVVLPAAGNIYMQFADAGSGILNYILSGTAITCAVGSFVAGKLMENFSKKKMLLLSFGLFMVGGIFGGAVMNVYYIAFMRTIIGLAMGFLCVLTISIISDVFADENERSSVMGIYNAMQAAMGAVLSWCGGMVAVYNWTWVFRIYLAAIPILFFLVFFVPETKSTAVEENTAETQEAMVWGKLIRTIVLYSIMVLTYSVVFYQVALIVIEKNLGTEAFSGTLSALGTIGSFVICSVFGVIYSKLKGYVPVVVFAGMAIAFFLLYIAEKPIVAAVACLLLGAMYGMGITYFLTACTVVVPPTRVSFAVGIAQSTSSVIGFLSTYATTLLCKILHVDTITETIPVLVGVLIVTTVVTIVIAVKDAKTAN